MGKQIGLKVFFLFFQILIESGGKAATKQTAFKVCQKRTERNQSKTASEKQTTLRGSRHGPNFYPSSLIWGGR